MKHFLYLFIVALCSLSNGQTSKIATTPLSSVEFDADMFVGFDGFSNCFYAKNNVLYKKTGEAVFQYQNLSLGAITKVDIQNPLRIIVFYEEFNSVIVLDNQLNEIQKIDFSKLETPVVATAIGISGQNKLWVYNSLDLQLGLYDLNTQQYTIIGLPIKDGLNYYQTDFNYFQWVDKQGNWNSCSIYGNITLKGKVHTKSNLVFLDDNKILFLENNTLSLRDQNTDKIYEIEIVEKSFKNFYYKDQILSIFTNRGITNYKIILP